MMEFEVVRASLLFKAIGPHFLMRPDGMPVTSGKPASRLVWLAG